MLLPKIWMFDRALKMRFCTENISPVFYVFHHSGVSKTELHSLDIHASHELKCLKKKRKTCFHPVSCHQRHSSSTRNTSCFHQNIHCSLPAVFVPALTTQHNTASAPPPPPPLWNPPTFSFSFLCLHCGVWSDSTQAALRLSRSNSWEQRKHRRLCRAFTDLTCTHILVKKRGDNVAVSSHVGLCESCSRSDDATRAVRRRVMFFFCCFFFLGVHRAKSFPSMKLQNVRG